MFTLLKSIGMGIKSWSRRLKHQIGMAHNTVYINRDYLNQHWFGVVEQLST